MAGMVAADTCKDATMVSIISLCLKGVEGDRKELRNVEREGWSCSRNKGGEGGTGERGEGGHSTASHHARWPRATGKGFTCNPIAREAPSYAPCAR